LDATDPERHFGTEVPRRAAYVPVIMNAILASSARHMALIEGKEDNESHEYHDKCLQILIPILDDPLESLDDSLFAAVIILRQYEEYDGKILFLRLWTWIVIPNSFVADNDGRCHLFGSTRLFNSGARSATPTKLREACSWVAIRQEIYVSLTTKQPHGISLDGYQDSSIFYTDTTNAWANRIVFLFAKVVNFAFGRQTGDPHDTWQQLDLEIQSWNLRKPQHFNPIWMQHRNHSLECQFPEVLMFGTPEGKKRLDPKNDTRILTSTVVGLQHYCLAKILLAVYDPRLLKLGFETHRLRKESEV
jgi:hypothetical protein